MSDVVGNAEDRFSRIAAQLECNIENTICNQCQKQYNLCILYVLIYCM